MWMTRSHPFWQMVWVTSRGCVTEVYFGEDDRKKLRIDPKFSNANHFWSINAIDVGIPDVTVMTSVKTADSHQGNVVLI